MFKREIKLMKNDFNYYLLKFRGEKCFDCPKNKCVLCVEEKKLLYKALNNKEKKQ